MRFHLKIWSRHRYERCVVLGKPFAERARMCKDAPPLLCSCLAFGLHGRCEHEQACLHFLRPGNETNLNIPGLASSSHRPSKYQQQTPAGIHSNVIVLQAGPVMHGLSDAQSFAADDQQSIANTATSCTTYDAIWELLVHLSMQAWYDILVSKHKMTVSRIAGCECSTLT